MNREEKQYLIEQTNTVNEIGEISDGFHTFNSLYNQRLYLWAALVKAYKNLAWKSIRHHDEEILYEKDECFSAPEYSDKLRINNNWYRITDKYFTFDGFESVCVIVVEPRGNLL